MARRGCGCNGTNSPTPEDSLLVKATGSSAARCGTGKSLGSEAVNCVKEDATYDIILGPFTIPAHNNNAPITVCDGSLYTPGQWIQFASNGNILQIQTVNNNVITLKNGCPNGVDIGNDVGDIVANGTNFVVVGAPECLTAQQKQSAFDLSISTKEELCMPALAQELSATAKMVPVGWKESDENDSSFGKCIKRIKGTYKKGISWFLTEMLTVSATDLSSWRRLVRNNTTGEIREVLSVSEDPDIEAGAKYVQMVTSTGEILVGPAYVYTPLNVSIYSNSTIDDTSSWPTIPEGTPLTQTVNVSVADVNALNIPGQYFYLLILFNIGIRQPNGFTVTGKLEIDSNIIAMVGGQGMPGYNSVMIPIRIDKNIKTFALKYTTTSNGSQARGHVSAKILGAYL